MQEEDAKRELQKMKLLTKAQTNAAVTAEKARQLEGTKELQIQVLASIDFPSYAAQFFNYQTILIILVPGLRSMVRLNFYIFYAYFMLLGSSVFIYIM